MEEEVKFDSMNDRDNYMKKIFNLSMLTLLFIGLVGCTNLEFLHKNETPPISITKAEVTGNQLEIVYQWNDENIKQPDLSFTATQNGITLEQVENKKYNLTNASNDDAIIFNLKNHNEPITIKSFTIDGPIPNGESTINLN